MQRKTKKRAENGQRKKQVNLGWHKDRKESPINAPSIHVGALGGCWFTLAHILLYYIIYKIVNSTEIQVTPTVMNIDATHLMQHVFPSELA